MPKLNLFLPILGLASCLLLACGEKEQISSPHDPSLGQSQAPAAPVGACQEPRPEFCTMDYQPVCGYGDKHQQTYSNGCSACADASVLGWVQGACEE